MTFFKIFIGVLLCSSKSSASNSCSNIVNSSPSSFNLNQFNYAMESTNLYENVTTAAPGDKLDRHPFIVEIKMNFDEETSSSGDNKNRDSKFFVCCINYDARIEGDLTLRFTDRVKLIHANKDFALVKNLFTEKCGWVPRYCIQAIAEFLEDIKFY